MVHTTYHFQYKDFFLEKSTLIILNLPLWDFSKGLQSGFKTAVVDEPSVLEPLKFYYMLWLYAFCPDENKLSSETLEAVLRQQP